MVCSRHGWSRSTLSAVLLPVPQSPLRWAQPLALCPPSGGGSPTGLTPVAPGATGTILPGAGVSGSGVTSIGLTSAGLIIMLAWVFRKLPFGIVRMKLVTSQISFDCEHIAPGRHSGAIDAEEDRII